MNVCLGCGNDLPTPKKKGRQRKYCDAKCKHRFIRETKRLGREQYDAALTRLLRASNRVLDAPANEVLIEDIVELESALREFDSQAGQHYPHNLT